MSLRLEKSVLRKHQKKSTSNKRFNILLVDDEKENLDSLSLVLDRDYNLLFANDGQEALDMIKSSEKPEDIHVIISDQRMPTMTGVQLFKNTSKLVPNAVRIILTGFTDADAIISSINDGQIYKFLTKPIDPVDLRMMVKNSLEYYNAEKANEIVVMDLKSKMAEVENTVKVFERFVPRQFKQNLAHDFKNDNSDNPAKLVQSDIVTVLFADIRSFREISKELEAQEILDFLNSCFDLLCDAVHKNSGSVDKFLGDSIMALFDSPKLSNQEEANNAVQAGLDIEHALKDFNTQRIRNGKTAIHIDIGIHTGPVIIGQVGAEQRLDLTLLGDTVNLATELESLNRIYNTSVIVSSDTYELTRNQSTFQFRELDRVTTVTRTDAFAIYSVDNSQG
jgi:class 3 adenylate cyclase/CheY-like chemotaxis protein